MTRRSSQDADYIRPGSGAIDTIGFVEAANPQALRNNGGRWYSWQRTSKQALRPLTRRRYYLTAVAIIAVLSIFLLYQRQGTELGIKTNFPFSYGHPASPAKPLKPPRPPKLSHVGGTLQHGTTNSSGPISYESPQEAPWRKPEGVKVIALIFYGRPETVSILDCYLKQNLVSNGGLLDEVHWAVNTDDMERLIYLNALVKTSKSYKKIKLPGLGFDSIWKTAVKRGNIYIKIDDDVVSPPNSISALEELI